ncbi:hypothetical protein QVD17_24203 [Tagetes erecta]|uniref:Glutathione transferase n=1 Tax=Tagetes erecta TaxID=13708 RepID=A0AAD8KJX5_TARER|nr:hypothetical protein QVD17_24203 [Tagetes erecta]
MDSKAHKNNIEESPMKLQLYSSYISPPSFSVRIALNLKGLDYDYITVSFRKGDQRNQEFLMMNPMGYVPTLKNGDMVVAESSAILMYLEEKYPQHPLLPQDLEKKTINYQAINIVASSMQPILRIPVLSYIRDNVGPDESIDWAHRHLKKGFAALEKLLKDHVGTYATGDEIFLADVFLAPYLIGYPERYNFDLSGFLILSKLRDVYLMVPAIQNAMPEKQPDFPV